jgi:hypothetical protein
VLANAITSKTASWADWFWLSTALVRILDGDTGSAPGVPPEPPQLNKNGVSRKNAIIGYTIRFVPAALRQ